MNDEEQVNSKSNPAHTCAPALAALRVLLDYLFLDVRQRDGVPCPPLFDRLDFLDFVSGIAEAAQASATPEERQGQAWLVAQMQRIAAPDPD